MLQHHGECHGFINTLLAYCDFRAMVEPFDSNLHKPQSSPDLLILYYTSIFTQTTPLLSLIRGDGGGVGRLTRMHSCAYNSDEVFYL